MAQPSALEVTLEYPDLSAFVAGFEMVTREGIELPSPFSRSPGETVRFVVRTLDRAIVLEGTGVVADVVDNGRLYRPNERYDLAIAFTDLSATSEVVIERILVAREFATSDPTGMRKIPPEVRESRASSQAAPRSTGAPAVTARPPAPVIREVSSSSDLLEEVDEEDFLTPPPRPLPGPPPQRSGPPPVPRKPLTVPPPTRPHGTTPRSSSTPPEAAPRPAGGPPSARSGSGPEPARSSSAPPARGSSAPPPRASSAPPPLPSRRPAASAPPAAKAPPPTDTFEDGVPIDTVTVTVTRKPPMDTQTEVRPAAAASPRAAPKASPPAPTKAAPVPRSIGHGPPPARQVEPAEPAPTAPPRRKTGARPAPAASAAAIDALPPHGDALRAPPRKKTLPGATGTEPGPSPAKPRRRTGAARPAIQEPGPDAPPLRRRRTGQRAAIPMPEDSPTTRFDAPAEDDGRSPPPPRRR
ncbi:MAG: hypothetical protein HYY06_05180 [Deltaproteobacteria bacterium]|nr:hypothetical protein [Deltaproteobacteria bacterium]